MAHVHHSGGGVPPALRNAAASEKRYLKSERLGTCVIERGDSRVLVLVVDAESIHPQALR